MENSNVNLLFSRSSILRGFLNSIFNSKLFLHLWQKNLWKKKKERRKKFFIFIQNTGELRIKKKEKKIHVKILFESIQKEKGKERTDSPCKQTPPFSPKRNNLRVRTRNGRGGENGRNEELNDACPPRPTESRCRINSRNSLWGGGEERRG